MKIQIVPRTFFEKIKNTKKEKDIVQNTNIISINTPQYEDFQEEFPPFSEKYWNNKNICFLKFHDYFKPEKNVILMTQQDVQKIKNFMKQIDKSKTLYIHCTAGKSRSQAIGWVLNLYYNKIIQNNQKDFWQFENKNKTKRRMNQYVKQLMLNTFKITTKE